MDGPSLAHTFIVFYAYLKCSFSCKENMNDDAFVQASCVTLATNLLACKIQRYM